MGSFFALLLGLALALPLAAQIPTSGLVAYYPFNGNANDESGNGNNGTPMNGVALTADRFGNANSAYSFDGVDDYVDVGHPEGAGISAGTISLWFKVTGTLDKDCLISQDSYDDGWKLIIYPPYAGISDDCYLRWIRGPSDGTNQFLYNVPADDGNWHNLTLSWDNDTTTILLDGGRYSKKEAYNFSYNSPSNTWIGARDKGPASYYYFPGLIDDIRIYNRALSEAEVLALYHEGGWDPGLVAHYPFNGNANDESGNGNDGTEYGAVLAADRFGNANSAYSFDGVDDYVNIPNSSEMGKGWTEITVSAWFNKFTIDANNILAKDVWTGNENDALFQLHSYSSGEVWFRLHTTSDKHANVNSSDTIDINTWNMATGIYDGSEMKIYINGQLTGSTPMTGVLVTGYTHYDLDIGTKYQQPQGRGGFFEGSVDDIRIYSRALSEAEIQALYHEGGWARGPLITNIATSTSPQVGDDITVTATVTDPDGLRAVDLHYARGGASVFITMPMSFQGNDTELGTIPGSVVTEKGVAYYIAAEDNLGNRDSSDVASVQVAFQPETFKTSMPGSAFRDGFPKNRWRLISIPGDIDKTSVSSIIQAKLGDAPSDETWKIFRYTGPGPDNYVAATSFASGQSYFLKQVVADDLHFTLGSGQSVDLTGWSLTIPQRRWRFVSSPYPFPVLVAVDQGIFKGPYAYGKFGPGGQEGWSLGQVQYTLRPWGGYIIYNNTTQTQTLEIVPPGLSKARLAKKSIEEQVNGWLMELTAEGERYFDAGNVIGRLQGAAEGLDDYDHPEPPYMEGYVSLTMERPDWEGELPLTSDIRSFEESNGVWDLDLRTRGETGPIAITCAIQGEVPPDMQVVLLDLVQRQAYDLTAGEPPGAITDYSDQLPYHLKVIAGTPGYVQGAIEEALAHLPEDFALSQNYPNPFNPSTTIRFALPRPTLVSLKVYNLLGQEVVTLADDWRDIGYHEVVWDGRDRAGRSAATGVYFAVLHADGHLFSRKMVLLK